MNSKIVCPKCDWAFATHDLTPRHVDCPACGHNFEAIFTESKEEAEVIPEEEEKREIKDSPPKRRTRKFLLVVAATIAVLATMLAVAGFLYFKHVNKPYRLDGSVFVVTKGGTNIKLGLVAVNVYPKEIINEVLSASEKASNEAHQTLEKEIESTRSLLAKADAELEEASKAYERLPYDSPEYDRLLSVAATKESARNKFVDPWNKLMETKRTLDDQIQETLASAIPTSSISARTNADGEFSLMIPTKGKYILIASGGRSIGDSEEKYLWVVSLPEKKANQYSIMLSNDNILPPGQFESRPFTGSSTN